MCSINADQDHKARGRPVQGAGEDAVLPRSGEERHEELSGKGRTADQSKGLEKAVLTKILVKSDLSQIVGVGSAGFNGTRLSG